MTDYKVKVYRQEYALYLTWEYGYRRANEILVGVDFVRDSISISFRLKREADSWAQRIREIVCWQRGRLGLCAKCPDVFVS